MRLMDTCRSWNCTCWEVCLENLDMSSLAPAAALDRLGYNQFSMCTTQCAWLKPMLKLEEVSL